GQGVLGSRVERRDALTGARGDERGLADRPSCTREARRRGDPGRLLGEPQVRDRGAALRDARTRAGPARLALDESAGPRDRTLRERRLEELARDDRSGAGAEPRAGPGARADLPEPLDRRGVAGAASEGSPEEVLVERERAAVGVAVPQVDVRPLQVVRAERDSLQDRGLEVGDVTRESCLDPVGVPLPELVRPLAVTDVGHGGSVTLDPPRQLLQLDPEQA